MKWLKSSGKVSLLNKFKKFNEIQKLNKIEKEVITEKSNNTIILLYYKINIDYNLDKIL